MEIRPVAGVDALKRRAQYSVLSEYHMNKSAAAQKKAHFNFLFSPRTFSLVRHWKRWGLFSTPLKLRRERTSSSRFRIASGGRWSAVAAARTCRVSLSLRFDVKKRSFPRISGGERPLTIPDRSLIDGIMQDDARQAVNRPQQKNDLQLHVYHR